MVGQVQQAAHVSHNSVKHKLATIYPRVSISEAQASATLKQQQQAASAAHPSSANSNLGNHLDIRV